MKKWILVGIAVIIIIGVIIIIAVASLFNSEQSKFTAEEYFDIFFIYHDGYTPENSKQLFVTVLILKIQPVEGDATGAYIANIPGNTQEQYLGTILKGENKTVTIQFNLPAVCPLKDEGYSLSFRIGCREVYGWITVYLQSQNESHS